MATLNTTEKNKIESYLVASIKFIFNQLPKHYMYLPGATEMYKTISLFERAVDDREVPGYSKVIKDPMDLSLMKKRVDSHKVKYLSPGDAPSFLLSILQDLDLIQHNCYLFNPNDVDAGVRMLVDGTRAYFRYLLRLCLQLVISLMPEKFHLYILGSTSELHDLILEPIPDVVSIFLSYRTVDIKQAFQSEELLKILVGPKVGAQKDTLATLDKVCQFPHVDDPLKPQEATSSTATKKGGNNKSKGALTETSVGAAAGGASSAKLSKPVSTATLKRSKSASKQPVNTAAEYEDDFVDLESPVHTNKGSLKYDLVDEDLDDGDMMDEEDAYYDDDEDDSVPGRKRSSVTGGKKRGSMKRKSGQPSARPLKRVKSSVSTYSQEDDIDLPMGEDYQVEAQGYYPTTTASSWHSEAEAVLKLLYKHVYVDFSVSAQKTASLVAADFFNPVVHPDYQREITHPMDLTTLQYLLQTNQLHSPGEFARKLLSIFQNAIDFNSNPSRQNMTTRDMTAKIIAKCEHLIMYTKWVCLEKLPLEEEEGVDIDSITANEASNRPPVFFLTKAAQVAARQEREDIINTMSFQEMSDSDVFHNGGSSSSNRRSSSHAPINAAVYKECKAIYSEIVRTRNKQEQEELGVFLVPINTNVITDYAVYVRRKMDLSTLMFKLDHSLPNNRELLALVDQSESPYESYAEYFKDLRLIFSNAIKFNEAHISSDTTQISLWISNVAKAFQHRLEHVIIPKHTLALADRIAMHQYLSILQQSELQKRQAQEAKEAQLFREKERQLIETYKQNDPIFAADLDREAKLRNTEKLLKEEAEAKKRAIVNSGAMLGSTSPGDDSVSSPLHSPEYGGNNAGQGGVGGSSGGVPKGPVMVGHGLRGVLPSKVKKELVELKERVSKAAWGLCASFAAAGGGGHKGGLTVPPTPAAAGKRHSNAAGSNTAASHTGGVVVGEKAVAVGSSAVAPAGLGGGGSKYDSDDDTAAAATVVHQEDNKMVFTANWQWKTKPRTAAALQHNVFSMLEDDDNTAMEVV